MNPTDTSDPNYFHRVVDCQWACPAHTNVPEYIRATPGESEPSFGKPLSSMT